jgi:hypothetical protein
VAADGSWARTGSGATAQTGPPLAPIVCKNADVWMADVAAKGVRDGGGTDSICWRSVAPSAALAPVYTTTSGLSAAICVNRFT